MALIALTAAVPLFGLAYGPEAARASVAWLAPDVNLGAISCASEASCVAVGYEDPGTDLGVVVSVTDGVAGPVVVVGGVTGLEGVACPDETTCIAVGQSPMGGAFVTITGGQPAAPVIVPGTLFLEGIACPTASHCVAVGAADDWSAAVVEIVDGSPTTLATVPGASLLTGIACPQPTSCVATGTYVTPTTQNVGVVVPIVNGVPAAAAVADDTIDVFHITCPSPDECWAVASGVGHGNDPAFGRVVAIAGGRVRSVRAVAAGTRDIGCVQPANCIAVGSAGGVAGLMPLIAGDPGPASPVTSSAGFDLQGVACPNNASCIAVGGNAVIPSIDPAPAATTLTAGAATIVPAPSTLSATLTRSDVNGGIPGQTIVFTVQGATSRTLCAAVTGPDGRAECQAAIPADAALARSYTATLQATQFLEGSSSSGTIALVAGGASTPSARSRAAATS